MATASSLRLARLSKCRPRSRQIGTQGETAGRTEALFATPSGLGLGRRDPSDRGCSGAPLSRYPCSPLRLEVNSIAILPLRNLSGDPTQDYFADGMTDELITQMAKVSSLRVVSAVSAMGYKNTTLSLASWDAN